MPSVRFAPPGPKTTSFGGGYGKLVGRAAEDVVLAGKGGRGGRGEAGLAKAFADVRCARVRNTGVGKRRPSR